VKLISKAFLLLAFATFTVDADAKQIKLTVNSSTHEEAQLDSYLNKGALDTPKQSPQCYVKQIEIKNCGEKVLENCLPGGTKVPYCNLDGLANSLREKDNPLHALYAVWTDTICPADDIDDLCDDPLYILNFMGYCRKDRYVDHFVTLCHQLGISTRLVSHKGRKCYDFFFQGRWEMLDPLAEQMYLGLDNQRVVASDDILDDPFIALRTKHSRKEHPNLEESWKELARFEIVNSTYAPEACRDDLDETEYITHGFDLYPQEKITYSAASSCNVYPVEHSVNPLVRGGSFHYTSPFPIREIFNDTEAKLWVEPLNLEINPGTKTAITNPHVFTVDIEVAGSCQEGTVHFCSRCSKLHFPLRAEENRKLLMSSPSTLEVTYDLNEEIETFLSKPIQVKNSSHTFDHRTPSFELTSELPNEKIWWQISIKPDFSFIPPSFEQIENNSNYVILPILTDTFFNADDTYYFRVKGCSHGLWSDWSETFSFVIRKPDPIVDVEFTKLGDGVFELSWEGDADANTEFLVFGSNSLDFIPSIYDNSIVNAVVNGDVVADEKRQNLQAITRETKCLVDGTLAYYRIIVRRHNQLSVPSNLIYVYDNDVIQSRNVLQVVELSDEREVATRVMIPTTYSKVDLKNPFLLPSVPKPSLRDLTSLIARHADTGYVRTRFVTPEIWEKVQPYLLPENHPVKSKLDRLFARTRVTFTNQSFKEAGFKRNRIGRFSRVMASGNPELPGVFIKAFADTELHITQDWFKWMHRIEGAKSVHACIHRHGYQNKFKVPQKWIYPLPAQPSPPTTEKVLRKNFILVAEDMQIYEHERNNDLYKKKMTKELLDAIYTIIQEEGLWDSCYAFNIPFSKADNKLSFVDTEYHHKWPVPYYKFTKYFSKDMAKYWEYLIEHQGPKTKPKTKKAA